MAAASGPSVTSPGQLRGPLVGALAGTPDDASTVQSQLVTVARLVADLVAGVSFASVTAVRDDTYTTVATTSELALSVDRAQYADQAGPCLTALSCGVPVGVSDPATTMAWPGFREAALPAAAVGVGLAATAASVLAEADA